MTIEIVEAKDMAEVWQKFIEVRERTLRHTEQIQEIQRDIKELQKWKKNGV